MKQMRLFITLIAILGIVLLAGCNLLFGPDDDDDGGSITIEVTGLAMDRAGTLYLEVADTFQLAAILTPSNANTGIVWESADTAIATVSQAGLVTAIGLGDTTVKVYSEEDPAVFAELDVRVAAEISGLTGFTLLNQTAEPVTGTTTEVPELVDGRTILISKHGVDQALLNSTGLTGYTLLYYDTSFSGAFKIKARVRIFDIVAPNTSRGVAVGAFGVPTGGALGDLATPVALMFLRNSSSTGPVELRGFWTKAAGNGVGTPQISPSITEYILEVERTVDGINLSAYNSQSGELISSGITGNPNNILNSDLNPGLQAGQPVYLGFAAGGGSMEISNIKIWDETGTIVYETAEVAGSPVDVSGVTLSGTEVNPDDNYEYQNSLANATGDTIQLTAAVVPVVADDTSVSWSSSNTLVATVEEDALDNLSATVTVVGAGTAIITVTTTDGGHTADYRLNIYEGDQPVQSLSLSGRSELMVGLTTPLSVTVSPSFATDQSVTWSSSNTDVATVSASGVVTGVAIGPVTITATANDGSGVAGIFEMDIIEAANLIWSWTAGTDADFTLSSSSLSTEIGGYTLYRTGGTITATADGLVLANGRFLLGSSLATATSASVYDPAGQLNFSAPVRLTVTYSDKAYIGTSTAPDFIVGLSHLYANNNTTGATNSVTPGVVTATDSGTQRVYEIDFTAGAHEALPTSFLQFRADSSNSITITSILLEYF